MVLLIFEVVYHFEKENMTDFIEITLECFFKLILQEIAPKIQFDLENLKY